MVFVLARKDAKNNERERERERRRSRSLEANSLSFWCAQKPRWKFFSFYFLFFFLLLECLVKEITENKGKVPLWTSRLKRVEYYIHSLSLSFL